MSEEYKSKFAISQSSLKEWKVMTPSKWYKTWVTKELERPPRPATALGSFLDCLMLTPDDIDKRFIVADVQLPSEKVQRILMDAFNHVEGLNKNIIQMNKEMKSPKPLALKEHTLEDRELIVSLCIAHDHYKNKPDQAYNDVLKKGADYFEFLNKTKGRNVISSDDNLTAIALKEILLNDKISKGFFTPKKGCDVLFQTRIYAEFDLDGFDNLDFLPTKGAIDIIHINHKLKHVREVDLKYTDDAFLFAGPLGPVKRFDYPGQHSFYDYLLEYWLERYNDGEYADYSIMPPLNVVIDDKERLPYIYAYDMDDLKIRRKGVDGTNIRGWEDDIREIAWHFDNEDWTRPREHQLNGYLTVKTFNKR